MYTLEDLNTIVLNQNTIPCESQISLKLYCEYYEKYIENNYYQVNDKITVEIDVKNVAHMMNLHKFYDPRSKSKKLKFPGAYSGINGFVNMKKEIITLSTIKKSNRESSWLNSSTKNRLLMFPYVSEILLKGQWFHFDKDKFNGNTKVPIDFIVFYQIQGFCLNLCITKGETGRYYCVSNFVVYKSNKYIKNQLPLQINQIIEYDKKSKIKKRVFCQNSAVRDLLVNNNYTSECQINHLKHERIMNRSTNFNSCIMFEDTEEYRITYLKIDSSIEKIINEK